MIHGKTALQNAISLEPINELIQQEFFIPSYQRGYRWNEYQVRDLLDDIWEFSEPKIKDGEFYCLQPVIVKFRHKAWELIDGQQRLTTIYIILKYLQRRTFKLKFETREDSEEFLADIDESKSSANIDYFHIASAYRTVREWFEEKDKAGINYARDEFSITLLKHTKVIWYQVEDSVSSIDIFTRINMGKISLTNAELIKALFLNSSNFAGTGDSVRLKQLEIAGEWDRIEYSLQDNKFWYFLNKEENPVPTRIEFIFEMIAGTSQSTDTTATFRYFNAVFVDIKEVKDYYAFWKSVKQEFMIYEEWFVDKILYHLVGFLIVNGVKLGDIKNLYGHKSKSEFRRHLELEVSKFVNFQVGQLDYHEDLKDITRLLLLFNLQTNINNENADARFPFDKYKEEKWSIEHIHAQNSKGLDTIEKQKSWLREVLHVITNLSDSISEEQLDDLEFLLNAALSKDKFQKDEFEILQNHVFQRFGNPEIHTVENLALLTGKHNSSLSNNIFPVKRSRIIEMELHGEFIPVCTRNVFLKYYSVNAEHLHFWGEDDRNNYIKVILETLIDFLPQQEDLNTTILN